MVEQLNKVSFDTQAKSCYYFNRFFPIKCINNITDYKVVPPNIVPLDGEKVGVENGKAKDKKIEEKK